MQFVGTLKDASDYTVDSKVNLVFIIDGGGETITTGSKGYIIVPAALTITGWTAVADQSGSIQIDVKRCTYANFPTTSSIAGSEKLVLSSAQKNQDTNLTSWTTTLADGDILEFYVDSATTITYVSFALICRKT